MAYFPDQHSKVRSVKNHPFTPEFNNLPSTLPVFPLGGVVLLPAAQLQLNIFEPRYLNMIFDALGAGRMIGILQPDRGSEQLYQVGCAGRLSAFSETADGRLLINLTGICRFDAGEEITTTRGYRRFMVDWSRFQHDMEEQLDLETAPLIGALEHYFEARSIQADMDSLAKMPAEALVNSLAINLPFEPEDKQSLVEAVSLQDRLDILIALARMGAQDDGGQSRTRH